MAVVKSYRVGKLTQLVSPGDMKAFEYVNYHGYSPGETHEEHEHDDREEIFLCVGGKGALTGSLEREVGKGDIILISPGEVHGFVSDEDDPLEYICIASLLP